MDTTLQQAEQRVFTEVLKGDSERDDALIERLQVLIQTLQGSTGKKAFFESQ